jgi:16S rRNA U1498 N3-methylase RsmE
VTTITRFLPFADEWLDERARLGHHVFVADPEGTTPLPHAHEGPFTLVLGPEGGFIPFERERLASRFDLRTIGERILRVETATAVALGRLLPS